MSVKKRPVSAVRIGTGYVSVIMIFVVISLTVLAALSLSAAGTNKSRNIRAHEFMNMYCEAESRGNTMLMKIDEAALRARGDDDFSLFETFVSETEGLECARTSEGYTVIWSEDVSDRVRLGYEVEVYEDPSQHGRKRYEITKKATEVV